MLYHLALTEQDPTINSNVCFPVVAFALLSKLDYFDATFVGLPMILSDQLSRVADMPSQTVRPSRFVTDEQRSFDSAGPDDVTSALSSIV